MAKQLVKDMKRTGILFYIIILQLASLLFVMGKGAGQIYLDMFLILLVITFGTYFLARVQGGNIKIVIYTIVLLTIGTMLQTIFLQEAVLANPTAYETRNPAAGLQMQYIIAFVAAVAAGFFTSWSKVITYT